MPSPDGIGSDRLPGKASHSSLSPSILTTLSQKAAKQNNQLATHEDKQ